MESSGLKVHAMIVKSTAMSKMKLLNLQRIYGHRRTRSRELLPDRVNDILDGNSAHTHMIKIAGIPEPAGRARQGRIYVHIPRIAGLPRGFAAAIHNHCRTFDCTCKMHQEADVPDIQPSIRENSGSFANSCLTAQIPSACQSWIGRRPELDEVQLALKC